MNSLNQNKNQYYRQLIVKHYSNPKNKGLLKTKASLSFHHFSNSCVDDFYIELTFNNNLVSNARFEGIGCAISCASIDIFCTMINNNDIPFVQNLVNNYQAMLEKKRFNELVLGDLLAFENVLKQPNRIKCAVIISQAINEILTLKVKNND